jgi:hypothetical protein
MGKGKVLKGYQVSRGKNLPSQPSGITYFIGRVTQATLFIHISSTFPLLDITDQSSCSKVLIALCCQDGPFLVVV